ncbi:hypothetical protein [Dysgonomonas sp. 25]|uniref:hypothetical protein n=1 Tax=Dysgonomonas sp. 25 TaxID=2302933 RepID=UPI0013D8AB2C|nr:hypothetical protein [Dysgonomonas sp. 25]NDV69217.1 hypothetical protein [Dysgonomonas sp. 25]
MKAIKDEKQLLRIIRAITLFFILALVVSGATAFPLETELSIITGFLEGSTGVMGDLYAWFARIYEGILHTNANYPFIMYGCDWLAFAHIVIAIAFVGVLRKPVTNRWIVSWAMIACVGVIPAVIICGFVREIPIFWQLVDSSFGIFGLIPLLVLRHYIRQLAKVSNYVEQPY